MEKAERSQSETIKQNESTVDRELIKLPEMTHTPLIQDFIDQDLYVIAESPKFITPSATSCQRMAI